LLITTKNKEAVYIFGYTRRPTKWIHHGGGHVVEGKLPGICWTQSHYTEHQKGKKRDSMRSLQFVVPAKILIAQNLW